MSLVSTYVESNEGHWYQNPVIEDDGWFICWDDDDPIELVIADETGLYAQTVLNRLHRQGWKLTILCTVDNVSRRLFNDVFKPATAYFLTQYRNGPTDRMLKDNNRLDAKPQGQGVYYYNRRNGGGV